MKEQAKHMKECLQKMGETVAENGRLRKQVEELMDKVEDLEQYTRKNCVEIQGVPVTGNEDVCDLIKKIGSSMEFEIDDIMVDNCHRLGKQLRDRGPPGIILKFVRFTDKEILLRKKRQNKLDFTARDIGFSSEYPIYDNESLSPARRRLFAIVKEMKKEKNYKYAWIRGGKIFMRKDEESRAIMITRKDDLAKV